MNGRNDDFASGDLINNILIKRLVKAISPGSRLNIKALYLDSFGRLRGRRYLTVTYPKPARELPSDRKKIEPSIAETAKFRSLEASVQAHLLESLVENQLASLDVFTNKNRFNGAERAIKNHHCGA